MAAHTLVERIAMNTLLVQLITIFGVLLGALGSYLSTVRIERARWDRERRKSRDERRLDAYLQFGNALREFVSIAYRIAAARGYSHMAHPLQPEDGQELLAEADVEVSSRWETVLLLGVPDTIEAGREWRHAA